jgi:hypothetical protein
MPTIRRASGITGETNGVEVTEETGGGPQGPRRRRAPGGAGRASARAGRTEGDIIAEALVDPSMKLVDRVPLRSAQRPPRKKTPGGRVRRRAPEATPATRVGVAAINVPLEPGERAVVLVEQDGVYSWQVAEGESSIPATSGRRKRAPGPRRAARKSLRRIAHFRIEVLPPSSPAPAASTPGKPRRRRAFGGSILRKVIGKAVAYIFKIVAKPVLTGVAKWLERDLEEGLVQITSADAKHWTRDPDQSVPIPKGRAARVLLFVHGTFSSTLGSFGSLGATDEGKAFLAGVFARYDIVIGWDHRTLSVSPADNARDLLGWFEAQAWPKPPVIDAVAFSRGGLVLRSLIEELLPSSALKARVSRAVFVACTNGGTELARPANWHRLAETYINVAAAGVRALAGFPAFTVGATILSEAVRGVGGLVKVLANAAVDDNAVPGLAAMNPGGPFVNSLNTEQPGQPSPDDVWYSAITSNFDPDKAAAAGRTDEIPPGLLLKLADKGADALHGKPNDLVVHVEAMTQIDPDVGAYVRERLDYGTNGTVHHCRYFAEPETADALAHWLQ